MGIERRNAGYGHGAGTLLLPSGQQLEVNQDENALDLNNVLARLTLEQWMSQDEAMDFLMGGGGRSATFDAIGRIHKGVVQSVEMMQQREYGTGVPKVWEDGQPMMQVVVALQTDERDDEEDDGVRKLYVRGQMRNAIQDAVRKAKHKGTLVGGVLAVKYSNDGKPPRQGFNAPKEYRAIFEPPEPFAETGFDEEPF